MRKGSLGPSDYRIRDIVNVGGFYGGNPSAPLTLGLSTPDTARPFSGPAALGGFSWGFPAGLGRRRESLDARKEASRMTRGVPRTRQAPSRTLSEWLQTPSKALPGPSKTRQGGPKTLPGASRTASRHLEMSLGDLQVLSNCAKTLVFFCGF